MNTHNNTHVKTAVGTFQVKYHQNGGRVGSYSVKLSDIKPRAIIVDLSPLTRTRINRKYLGNVENRIHAYFARAKRISERKVKGYVV